MTPSSEYQARLRGLTNRGWRITHQTPEGTQLIGPKPTSTLAVILAIIGILVLLYHILIALLLLILAAVVQLIKSPATKYLPAPNALTEQSPEA